MSGKRPPMRRQRCVSVEAIAAQQWRRQGKMRIQCAFRLAENSYAYKRKNRRISPAVCVSLGRTVVLLTDGLASNLADVFAGNAEVAEFAVGHAAEFVDGLAILDPIVVSACEVHGHFLSNMGCIYLCAALQSDDLNIMLQCTIYQRESINAPMRRMQITALRC